MCRFVLSAARAGKQDNQSDMADQPAGGWRSPLSHRLRLQRAGQCQASEDCDPCRQADRPPWRSARMAVPGRPREHAVPFSCGERHERRLLLTPGSQRRRAWHLIVTAPCKHCYKHGNRSRVSGVEGHAVRTCARLHSRAIGRCGAGGGDLRVHANERGVAQRAGAAPSSGVA